jgi:hypothetical protein
VVGDGAARAFEDNVRIEAYQHLQSSTPVIPSELAVVTRSPS